MSRSIRDADLTHGNVGESKRIRKCKAGILDYSISTQYVLFLHFVSKIIYLTQFILPFRSRVFSYI